MVRQTPLPDLVIVTTIRHKLSKPARSEGVVDSEATPRCAALRPAEPRVFLFGPMLPAPEVHEAAVRQTRKPHHPSSSKSAQQVAQPNRRHIQPDSKYAVRDKAL